MAQARAEAAAAASVHVERNIDHPIAARPGSGNFLRLPGAVRKHHRLCLVLSCSFPPSPGIVYCPRMHLGVFQNPCEALEPTSSIHRTGQLLERVESLRPAHRTISCTRLSLGHSRVPHSVPSIPIDIRAPSFSGGRQHSDAGLPNDLNLVRHIYTNHDLQVASHCNRVMHIRLSN